MRDIPVPPNRPVLLLKQFRKSFCFVPILPVIADLESRRYTATLLLAFHRLKLVAPCEDMLVRVHE